MQVSLLQKLDLLYRAQLSFHEGYAGMHHASFGMLVLRMHRDARTVVCVRTLARCARKGFLARA